MIRKAWSADKRTGTTKLQGGDSELPGSFLERVLGAINGFLFTPNPPPFDEKRWLLAQQRRMDEIGRQVSFDMQLIREDELTEKFIKACEAKLLADVKTWHDLMQNKIDELNKKRTEALVRLERLRYQRLRGGKGFRNP